MHASNSDISRILRLEFHLADLPQNPFIHLRYFPSIAGGRVALQADDQRLVALELDLAAVVTSVQIYFI